MDFPELKPNDIHRSVKAVRIDRVQGDAPTIGRVSRMPGAGRPKGRRRKRPRGGSKRLNKARRRKIILRWSILLGMIAMGVIVVAVALWVKSSKARSTHADFAGGDDPTGRERVTSRFESPSEEEALKWVKLAMQARDPAAVKKYFRLRNHSPDGVVKFLESRAKLDGPVTGYTWYSSMDRNGLLIDGVLVLEDGGSTPKKRLALLTPDEKGVWKIDYEAFARICDPSWNEVLDAERGGGLVRVFVADDTYYNGIFRDDSRWSCYRMRSPDVDEILMGYCRKGSAQAKAITRIIENTLASGGAPEAIRAALEIKRVDGAEPKQFEITRVLAEDWVLSDVPFDERSY